MSNINIVKELIRGFVKVSVTGTESKDEMIRKNLESTIFEQLKEEIISMEIDSIKNHIIEENNRKEKVQNIQRVKLFMFETLILGFLVGLAVNQATDIISFIKGDNINLSGTAATIIIILCITLIFIFLSYLNKLETIFFSVDKNK